MVSVEELTNGVGGAVRRIFDEADDARMLLSADRRVVLVNQACEQLFGRSREELLGRPARVLTPPRLAADYERVYDALAAVEGSSAINVSLFGLRGDGREFPARVSCRRLELEDGQALLSLVVVDRSRDDGETRQLRDFLEAVQSGNLIVDATGRIVMANARAQEMFGYAEDELVGHSVEELVPDAHRSEHPGLRGGFAGRDGRHVMGRDNRVEARRRDGSLFPVRVLLSSIGVGDEVLVAASVRDLSEIEALRGESDRLKDQFLATVSHELRTPLTSIMGSVEMLADEVEAIEDHDLRARLTRFTNLITRGARRQLALVEDLLTITSIDRGAARTAADLADLTVVVENVVHEYGPRAEAAGVSLVPEPTGVPVLARGDERWLGRAVECLVSNAVKFSPPGGVVALTTGVDGPHVWLEVSDQGPGIPPDEVEVVFRRLQRGSAAVAGEVPGAGLGLAIARAVVDSVGGRLEVVPQASGARLRMTLVSDASTPSQRG